MLVLAGDVEPSAAFVASIAQIADAVALTHVVVDAIAVGIDRVARHRNRIGPLRLGGAGVEFTLVERTESRFDASGQRLADAGLGDDVDDAADRAVAVQHRAAIAAGNFDALDGVARDRTEIEADGIEIGQPPSVDQNQRVGGSGRAEAAHVDRRADAILAAGGAVGLDADLLRQYILDRRSGRTRDVFSGDDAVRGAGNAGAGAARPNVEHRQHLRILRVSSWRGETGQREQCAPEF